MVELYDETRTFDQACFDAALDYLVDRFPPERFPSIVEPGIGTGRIAIPLAERGYQVAGSDISADMLALLRRKLERIGQPLSLSFHAADAIALPYPDAAFDMAVAVHLFYFISDWQRAAREVLRVVRNDGPLILMQTGRGTEIPLLTERYKDLCAERGCRTGYVGVPGTKDVVAYFESLGRRSERVHDRWRWVSRVRLDKGLEYMRLRAYSYTTYPPDAVHDEAIAAIEDELIREFGSLEVGVEVPNEVHFTIISRDSR